MKLFEKVNEILKPHGLSILCNNPNLHYIGAIADYVEGTRLIYPELPVNEDIKEKYESQKDIEGDVDDNLKFIFTSASGDASISCVICMVGKDGCSVAFNREEISGRKLRLFHVNPIYINNCTKEVLDKIV